jgi:hypothetical protein
LAGAATAAQRTYLFRLLLCVQVRSELKSYLHTYAAAAAAVAIAVGVQVLAELKAYMVEEWRSA